MIKRVEKLSENVTLCLGDCREVLPTLGKFDACVTDPPYGIDAENAGGRGVGGWTNFERFGWDKERPPVEAFDTIRAHSKVQIIWGGNYFTDYLPPSMQWLVWDKGQRDFSLADCEFAWSSERRAARIFTYPRAKALQDGKQHPTQKPVELMKWCIEQLPKGARNIVDPFLGSGTTGVAAVKMGKAFAGIEVNETYFDIACKRISAALMQPDMFLEQPKATPQHNFTLELEP